jgi:hypothetical protein
MAVLVLALYAEGSVDTLFLPSIIQRTSEAILAQYSLNIVDVPEIIIIPKKHGIKLDQCILQASQDAKRCHALLIHNDADNLGYDTARQQRFIPGFNLVQQNNSETCHYLIPVIPVRMIESWMLADVDTLLNILGTDLSPQQLRLPTRAALVENITDPKDMLNNIIRTLNTARSRRRQAVHLSAKYEALARQVDLNKLFEVPACKEFVNDLAKTLEELHFIPYASASKILSNSYFSKR